MKTLVVVKTLKFHQANPGSLSSWVREAMMHVPTVNETQITASGNSTSSGDRYTRAKNHHDEHHGEQLGVLDTLFGGPQHVAPDGGRAGEADAELLPVLREDRPLHLLQLALQVVQHPNVVGGHELVGQIQHHQPGLLVLGHELRPEHLVAPGPDVDHGQIARFVRSRSVAELGQFGSQFEGRLPGRFRFGVAPAGRKQQALVVIGLGQPRRRRRPAPATGRCDPAAPSTGRSVRRSARRRPRPARLRQNPPEPAAGRPPPPRYRPAAPAGPLRSPPAGPVSGPWPRGGSASGGRCRRPPSCRRRPGHRLPEPPGTRFGSSSARREKPWPSAARRRRWACCPAGRPDRHPASRPTSRGFPEQQRNDQAPADDDQQPVT